MAKGRKIEPVHVFVEIVVITIGILIAYQLNTIKEASNTNEAEKKILKEIRSNLELDKIDLISNKKAHQRAILLLDSLRSWEGDYSDEVGYMIFGVFRDYLFMPQTSAFETLKAKGVDLIKNDSIRVQIQRLQDFYYRLLIQYESEYIPNQFHDDFMFVVENHFKTFPVRDSLRKPIPISTNTDWLKNPKVRVRLDLCDFEHRFSLGQYEGIEKEINNLIEAIDIELEN